MTDEVEALRVQLKEMTRKRAQLQAQYTDILGQHSNVLALYRDNAVHMAERREQAAIRHVERLERQLAEKDAEIDRLHALARRLAK